jgi:hypothetical protein
MTGVQAPLEKIAPSLPMKPGQVERQEFEYRRHGTQTLIASFDVATGQVQGTVGERRTEQDFTGFLEDLLASASGDVRWHIVWDNLDIHLSESVVRLVARHCGLAAGLFSSAPWVALQLQFSLQVRALCGGLVRAPPA